MSTFEWSTVLSALPPDVKAFLSCAAIPRVVTAEVIQQIMPGNERVLDKVPFLDRASWDVDGTAFVISPSLRHELMQTISPDALASANTRLAEYFAAHEDERNRLFHELYVPTVRDAAVDRLRVNIERAIAAGDIAKAHDLLRIAKDHPSRMARDHATNLDAVIRDLSPRIARRARWRRERDATEIYFERKFDRGVWDRLLEGPQWILQLFAPGGFGKSMFVQNLIARRCTAQEVPVGRIDFDYVAHLDAATTQPWRLLLMLARQLNDQLPGEPFTGLLNEWGHLELRTIQQRRHERTLGERATAPDDSNAAREVPVRFRAVLEEWRGHVVIALDTTENLLHDDDAAFANILRTFVHVKEAVAGLRLVLAGRFDLASAADGEARVPGFVEEFIGKLRGTGLGSSVSQGDQALSLAVPGFSPQEGHNYLAEKRRLTEPQIVATCCEKSGGNPMKLAMLADMVTGPNPLTLAELRADGNTDLKYLVYRVLDRIADPRVQWLVRWGTIPQLLTREFAQDVLWPMLLAHHQDGRVWDDPSRDDLAVMGRGNERLELGKYKLDFAQAWSSLVAYSAEASWLSPVPELSDTQRFHPEIRDPIRGLLRAKQQDIYHECCRRSLAYWQQHAGHAEGAQRQRIVRAIAFHALEPFDGRPEPVALFRGLFDSVADDLETGVAIAEEILDVERRAKRHDREELPLPPPPVLAMAHRLLAIQKTRDLPIGQATMAQVHHHLALSDLSPGMRAAHEGRAFLSVGDEANAETWFAAALERSWELDSETSLWTAVHLGELRGDVAALERIVKRPQDNDARLLALGALSRQYERLEQLDDARDGYRALHDHANAARCLIEMGELEAGEAELEQELRLERRYEMAAELCLANYDPGRALEVLDRAVPTSLPDTTSLRARIHAMLCEEVLALGQLESMTRAATGTADPIVAARVFLDDGKPRNALEILRAVAPSSPRLILARKHLLEAEALGCLGATDEASAAFELVASLEPLPRSVQAALEIGRLQLLGCDVHSVAPLTALIASCTSPRWRLMMLRGLTRVGDPRSSDSAFAGLLQLTSVDDERALPTLLALRRVEVLRLAFRTHEAVGLAEWVLRVETNASRLAGVRAALHALDRVAPARAVAWRIQEELRYPVTVGRLIDRLRMEDVARRKEAYPGHVGMGPHVKPTGLEGLESLESVGLDESVVFIPRDLPRGSFVWNESDAVYMLPKQCPGNLFELGELLRARVPATAREVVILAAREELSWVPWQLAMTADWHPARSIRRAIRPPLPASETRMPIGERRLVGKTVSALVSRRLENGAMLKTDLNWHEWTSLVSSSQPSVIHIIANLEQRRDGAVVLDVSSNGEEATGAAHLARALNRTVPHLVILEVPWPGSDPEAARQLFLRERFAWQVLREYEHANLLCVGFAERPDSTPGELDRLATLVGSGLTLPQMAERLQSAELTTRSFGELLEKRGTSIYTNHPKLAWG